MNLFESENYKEVIVKKVRNMPKKGHGQFRKIAAFLRVHTTLISQVINGPIHLTLEQAQNLCEYFGFNELETDYFISLVQYERAGNQKLKNYFYKQIEKIRKDSLKIDKRIEPYKELDDTSKGVFYSSWFYSAIRLLTSIPGCKTRYELAEVTQLPISKVNEVIEFLLLNGLCVEKDNSLDVGPSQTFLKRESPFYIRHHENWRTVILKKISNLGEKDLVYTNPVVLSEKDYDAVREELSQFIEKFRKRVAPSPCEKLACLNIDWFQVVEK